MTSLRRRIGDVFVTATCHDDGKWDVAVTDAFFETGPVTPEQRKNALNGVLAELSSLRAHIWHEELGHPRNDDSKNVKSTSKS